VNGVYGGGNVVDFTFRHTNDCQLNVCIQILSLTMPDKKKSQKDKFNIKIFRNFTEFSSSVEKLPND
jgi:hypothetical protein